MRKTDSELIHQLSSFGMIQEDNIEDFENILYEVLESSNIGLIKPLLFLLDDSCEFDEIMFGIIHTLERFERNQYFEELGKYLPDLYSKAPNWSGVLHIRILNSPEAYDCYLNVFWGLPNASKVVLLEVLRAISEREKFTERCMDGITEIELALKSV